MTDHSIELRHFIETALQEDLGDGDHSSLSCIPLETKGKARLLIKQEGVISGVNVAKEIFRYIDPHLEMKIMINDATLIYPGDMAFTVEGGVQSILKSERLVLNVMQRMSGIATKTARYVKALKGLKTKVLDTRKTTPGMRFLEKEAIRHGGGANHRMGLYDMIMLKDNHIDYAGGLEQAIARAILYRDQKKKDLLIEVEARSIDDVQKILEIKGVNRIMLDNFDLEQTRKAVDLIRGRMEIESSGAITLENLRSYAECGVDYISVGALTHHISAIDMSLKATQY